jgi:hypothetical protein
VEERTNRALTDLRRPAASLMFASGLNVVEVSKILGDANPTIILNRYMRLSGISVERRPSAPPTGST